MLKQRTLLPMKHLKKSGLAIAALALCSQLSAITIGYYDATREQYGFSGGGPYLSNARQWLVDQGHTLVSTNNVDSTFLSGVDAFYTGLISSVSAAEVSSFQDFVDVQGGFLFIQTDWAVGPWTSAANTILSNWGIAHGGTYGNDVGHVTVGSSEWVTDPNVVNGFIGSAHSVITSAPGDFEVLAQDDAGRTILGVFDAGAGRSSDVLIATDINFWDNSYGWSDARNRALWENIWTSAANQTTVPETSSTVALLGAALLGMLVIARRKNAR